MADANDREIALAAEIDAQYVEESERLESPSAAAQRCQALIARALAAYREELGNSATPTPVPMLLRCPECNKRHVDVGAFAERAHHTHSCQHCGMTWRPAIVPTVGVMFLPGFKNEPEAARDLMETVEALLREVGAYEIRLNDEYMVAQMPSNAPAPVVVEFDDGMEDERHDCSARVLAQTLGEGFSRVARLRALLASGELHHLLDEGGRRE